MRAVFCLWFLLSALYPAELPKLAPPTMRLIDTARGVAPEFSSDLLLRLASSKLITDPLWKRQLIEEAFAAGAHAQLPYAKRGEPSTDTHTTRLYWRNHLEALSLQTQAVEAMLALNPNRAREMFDEIATPQVPPLPCKETGAADLSAYYATGANVFETGFTPDQREQSAHLHFLERIVAEVRSPAQVSPALALLFEVHLTPEQLDDLLARFAGVLDHINGTPREFEAAAGSLMAHVGKGADVLIPSQRAYIVRHESGPRCSDDRITAAGPLPFAAFQFNSLIKIIDPTGTRFAPIQPDEVKPSKIEPSYPSTIWWQSKRSRQVLEALKWLNHGNRDLPDDKRFFTLEERKSNDWNAHYTDTLKLIEGWEPHEEPSPDDWFGMVAQTYSLLAEMVPGGAEREAAFGRYLNFVETHYADVENHNFWFTALQSLWTRDRWLADRCAQSRNPVIATYTEIAKLK